MAGKICSHSWIDPNDPPIHRAPYSPILGPHRRQMKPDTTYVCNNCGWILKTRKESADGVQTHRTGTRR